MAKEFIILELNVLTDWDGSSPTTLSRDDAIVTGQRYYKFDITGPHGVLAGQRMVCDLEVAPVHTGDRLRGRYQGGL